MSYVASGRAFSLAEQLCTLNVVPCNTKYIALTRPLPGVNFTHMYVQAPPTPPQSHPPTNPNAIR